MTNGAIFTCYARSFFWVLLFSAIAISVALDIELVFFDLVHGNSHRTFANVVFMMISYPPVMALIIVVFMLLVFGLPQLLQAVATGMLVRSFGDHARLCVLPMLPLTAVATWYCFDYLTPTDFNLGINVPPDWTLFEHGLSFSRYAKALMFQAAVTLFSFLYLEARLRHTSRAPLIVIAFLITIAGASTLGYFGARTSIELQASPPAERQRG